MKLVSVTLGLVGLLVSSLCAGSESTPRPRAFGTSVERHCAGPVTLTREMDVRSVGAFCNIIDGDLRIAGTDITDLDGLEGIHSVRYLVVIENQKLTSMKGLSGLRTARAITIMENPSLTSLHGFEGVSTLDAAIVANNGLTSLAGLEGLRSTEELVVVSNPALTNLDAIQHLASANREIAGNGTVVAAPGRLAGRE